MVVMAASEGLPALSAHMMMMHFCELVRQHLDVNHTFACSLQEDTEEKVEEKKRQLYEEDIDAILARAEVSCWFPLSSLMRAMAQVMKVVQAGTS